MNLDLPDPWRFVRPVPADLHDALEEAAGPDLPYAANPKTREDFLTTARKWIEIEDTDRGTVLAVRMQADADALAENVNQVVPWTVSAVVARYSDEHRYTGKDFRALPLAALEAAYSRAELEAAAGMNRFASLLNDEGQVSDPLEPLGRSKPTPEFSARVARQYMALEAAYPGENTTEHLRKLNGLSEATAQRWIARARSLGMLAPAEKRGRRRGA